MYVQLYVYKCGNCGNTFKTPELLGDPYGEFLMRSTSGDLAYLSGFDDLVFQEVKDYFARNELLSSYDEMYRAKIFHKIFGVACDRAADKSEYQIGRDPICPKCHSNDKLSWHPSNPPEIIDIQIHAVTHNDWNKLNECKKEEVLNNAVMAVLNR